MSDHRISEFIREDIVQEAAQIAHLLDDSRMDEANMRLLRASEILGPEDFNTLATVVNDLEINQKGGDLLLDSPDLERHNLALQYGRGRSTGLRQNQSQFLPGNGRYQTDATLVGVHSDAGRVDIGILRSSVDLLDGTPYREPAHFVAGSLNSGNFSSEAGGYIADLLDTGNSRRAVQILDEAAMYSPVDFMIKSTVADGLEHKGYGADMFKVRIEDSHDNYFNRREQPLGRHQNQPLHRRRNHPHISETLVSTIYPVEFDGNGATAFARFDIALMRSSVEPLRRAN